MGRADGSEPRKVADAEENRTVKSPVWSPDSHLLAYMSEKQSPAGSDSSTILVQPAASGPARVLLADSDLPKQHRLSHHTVGLAWCSDGRLVFPVADRTNEFSPRTNFSLWQVRVDATTSHFIDKPSQLTEDNNFSVWNTVCRRRQTFIGNKEQILD